jgi:hypothetical protein
VGVLHRNPRGPEGEPPFWWFTPAGRPDRTDMYLVEPNARGYEVYRNDQRLGHFATLQAIRAAFGLMANVIS